jgi:hypothetical protein
MARRSERRAHDGDRAVAVVEDGLSDRAQQQPTHRSTPAGADDHQGCVAGVPDQHAGRGATGHLRLDVDLGVPGGPRRQPILEILLLVGVDPRPVHVRGQVGIDQRLLRRVHGDERHSPPRRFVEGEAERLLALRAVDTDHDRPGGAGRSLVASDHHHR